MCSAGGAPVLVTMAILPAVVGGWDQRTPGEMVEELLVQATQVPKVPKLTCWVCGCKSANVCG